MSKTLWKKKLIHIGCISTDKGLPLITKKQSEADLIELRFDTLYANHIDALEQVLPVLQKRKNPVLLTLRTKNEGGSHGWKSTERIRLFEKLLPHVDAVDFELANLQLLKPPLALARRLKKKIIFSAHSINRKITYKHGQLWISKFRKTRAETYKIATLCRTSQDLNVLVKLLVDHPGLRLALMAIGPMAEKSRKVLPLLGSRFVYGYLDAPAAKGQPSLKDVRANLA
jgi:3-dehydroquinate dehydratase-1